MRSVKITVKGTVQGVFFRIHTQKEAIKLKLYGYVTNKPDGSVYIEAEGKPQNIENLILWCYQGSPLSSVSEVSVEPSDIKNYADFSIRG